MLSSPCKDKKQEEKHTAQAKWYKVNRLEILSCSQGIHTAEKDPTTSVTNLKRSNLSLPSVVVETSSSITQAHSLRPLPDLLNGRGVSQVQSRWLRGAEVPWCSTPLCARITQGR